MAFGFIAKNGNDTFIIDGSSSTYRSLQIKQVGTSSSISHSAGDIIFATRSTSGALYGTSTSTSTTLYGATSWFVAGPPSTYSGSDNYGLQVYNQGSGLAYDSRFSSSGFSVLNVFPTGTISGRAAGTQGTPGFTTGDVIYDAGDPRGTIYISMSNALYTSTAGTEVAFGGAYYTSTEMTYINFIDIDAINASAGPPSFSSVILADYTN